MKKLLILIICSLVFIDCNKVKNDPFDDNDPSILYKNTIADGIYMGNIVYQGKSFWCEIEFDKNKYEEWPSGGALYQKEMSCLTLGTDTIINGILTFKLDSYKHEWYPFPCNPAMILPGDYKIHLITENDSIIFSKGVEKNKIKYYLKRIYP
jgi:hypothetical protein